MKHPKMDRYLVAGEQEWEIAYIAQKFGISIQQVWQALFATGSRSRRTVYKYINENFLNKDNGTESIGADDTAGRSTPDEVPADGSTDAGETNTGNGGGELV